MKKLLLLASLCIMHPAIGATRPDALMDILAAELNREMSGFAQTQTPPYYICYRVEDEVSHYISATNGALMQSNSRPQRVLTTQVRVGDNRLNNFHATPKMNPPQAVAYPLTRENDPDAIRRVLWIATDREYNAALAAYNQILADRSVLAEEEDKAPDYTPAQPLVYIDKPLKAESTQMDMKSWNSRAKHLSALFKAYPDIENGSVTLNFRAVRKYFVSTEDVRIAENASHTIMMISASTRADDGMVLPLTKTYYAPTPDGLPSDKQIAQDIAQLAQKLLALRVAPVVDPYSGPALLSGDAAGVFFHEIFGHRIEGQRMKSGTDGQTFKKMVGHQVLPDHMSVVDDPSLSVYNGKRLYGHYLYDDEGVRGERVLAVENGILKDFLMTRTPIDSFPRSNGHGRATMGKFPVTRQSNLIVETTERLTRDDLRRMLSEEARKQGKEYGLMFITVEGGFTNATNFSPSAFNVLPTEVYKVYADGRPDELVRGIDIVGTPLAMFSSISHAGGEPRMFTGLCGAESGSVPVTATAPDILVQKIEVQKKNKDSQTQPVLPRPY